MRLTVHEQFMVAAAIAMTLTLPPLLLAWRLRLRHRSAISALYVTAFALIAITFPVDSTWNPPLFLHGFTPGIAIGLLLAYFGLYREDVRHGRFRRRVIEDMAASAPVGPEAAAERPSAR